MVKLTPKNLRIIKTFNLYLSFLALGLGVAVPGPTLLDLAHLVRSDTQHIAFIYTARSVGYLVGSLIAGVLLDFFKSQQCLLTISNFVASLTMLGIPWSRSLGTLTGSMVVNGLSLGGIDTGSNVCCLNMWGKDSGPYYQALHFMFGLGGLIAPLIAAPFLTNYASETSLTSMNNVTFANETALFNASTENSHEFFSSSKIPPITFAYSIIGCFGVFVSLLFLMVWIVSPSEDKVSANENKETRKRTIGFICLLTGFNVILVFVETGTEIGFAQMLTTYAVKGKLKLPTVVGSYMTSTFWAAFTVGRLVSVFLAIKLSSFTLILCDLVLTSIGSVILLFLSAYEWSLWLSSVLLGVGIASFFPAAIGWLDKYINVTNRIASIIAIGAAFGEMVIPFTISSFIEAVPNVFIYIVPASCVLTAIVVFLVYLIVRNKEDKFIEPPCPTCYVISNSSFRTTRVNSF